MRQTQFWKRYTCAIALLILPALCKADVILDWNAIMEAMVTTQPPFPQARFAAITQLAVFEAVNSITHDYQPYLGTTTASPGASPEAAAIAAAHTVLKSYFPANGLSLDAARATSLAAIPNSTAKSDGMRPAKRRPPPSWPPVRAMARRPPLSTCRLRRIPEIGN